MNVIHLAKKNMEFVESVDLSMFLRAKIKTTYIF